MTEGAPSIVNLKTEKAAELLGLTQVTPLKDGVAESVEDFKACVYLGFMAWVSLIPTTRYLVPVWGARLVVAFGIVFKKESHVVREQNCVPCQYGRVVDTPGSHLPAEPLDDWHDE